MSFSSPPNNSQYSSPPGSQQGQQSENVFDQYGERSSFILFSFIFIFILSPRPIEMFPLNEGGAGMFYVSITFISHTSIHNYINERVYTRLFPSQYI